MIEFRNDKKRWESVYGKDILNSVKEDNYKPRDKSNFVLLSYEYMHDPKLQTIVSEGKKKNEGKIEKDLFDNKLAKKILLIVQGSWSLATGKLRIMRQIR